jgi:hypothetical protein
LNWFETQFPEFENTFRLEADRSMAEAIASINLNKLTKETIPAIERYIAAAAPCRQAYKALLALVRSKIDAKEWTAVLIQVKKYGDFFYDPDF